MVYLPCSTMIALGHYGLGLMGEVEFPSGKHSHLKFLTVGSESVSYNERKYPSVMRDEVGYVSTG
jgi:hypothetical protein